MIDVIPGIGITEKTIAEVRQKVADVSQFVSWVQIDFSDGTLIPNKTVTDMGELKSLIADFPNLSFEAHLMVNNPEKYVRDLSLAGFKRLVAHVEANDIRLFLDEAEYESVEVGVALDGPTEFDQIEPLLDHADFILIMTVEMGESGRPFLPETVEKIKTIHENLPDLPIEVDGGMNEQTAKLVKDSGATRIVTTSYIFKNPGMIAQAVKSLL
jgi:ribulose-phosphate 3-epimerase